MSDQPTLSESSHRDGLDVMVDVQKPDGEWYVKTEEHRQMARAAIRVARRHGISDHEIKAEYDEVRRLEASRNV